MYRKIILKTKIFSEPAEKLWWRWTTHEGLLSFFGNDNKVELELNGPFEIYFLMENPYGLQGSEGCKIISFLPEKMLSFTWNAPPQHKEIRNHSHQTWVVLNFNPIDEKHTEIELNHLGWLEGEQWDMVYDYFEKAWDSVFERLETSCGK
jgi:uncharacterized protein YndB with AHSA1/START domain